MRGRTPKGSRVSTCLALLAAIAIAGCKGDRGTSEKRAKPDREAQQAAAGAAPRSGRPHLPPVAREVSSAITGKRLRPWARARPTGDGQVAGTAIPAEVSAELVALLEPVARARPTIAWVRVMKRDGGAPAVALAYEYALKDTYGSLQLAGFTTVRDRGGKFHIHQIVEVTKYDTGDWHLAEDRDVDGDGVPDTIVVYNQTRGGSKPGSSADGGLVILTSKAAAALSVRLFERDRGDAQTELTRPFSNCWTRIGNKEVLVVIRQEDTMVEAGGEEKSMKTKYTSEVFAADKSGALVATPLYAGILGGATQADPLLDEWAEWTKSKAAPAIALEPRSKASAPVDCPVGERLAFIVPKRATKPKGNLGYYLLAWPSLLKADTAKEVVASGLPETAVVELGATD